jgi:DsbC/DsbD-like thiol-disulfide interchange protein
MNAALRIATGLFAFAVLFDATSAVAAPKKSEDRVKVAVKSAKNADGSETISIALTIDKGWHIYANPVGFEDLASAQTTVAIDGKPKPEVLKVEFPAGDLVKDVVGEYKVYHDKVTIKAHVRRGESSPLTVAIRFQACDNKSCLQASTVKVNVP